MEKRGRPPGPLAHVMDATAVAHEFPVWDREEWALVAEVYANLSALLAAHRGEPDTVRALDDILVELRRWARGDRTENERHEAVLVTLRKAAGLLDAAGPGKAA